MTVPSPQCGNFDLYKLEVQNPTAEPLPSKLFVAVNGPPDMHVQGRRAPRPGRKRVPDRRPVGRPQAGNPRRRLVRQAGESLCDVRAESGPPSNSYRLGLDGLPVVYRFKAEAAKKYVVCLAAPPHIGRLLSASRRSAPAIWFSSIASKAAPRRRSTASTGSPRPGSAAVPGIRRRPGRRRRRRHRGAARAWRPLRASGRRG